jgi:hypothetical protein
MRVQWCTAGFLRGGSDPIVTGPSRKTPGIRFSPFPHSHGTLGEETCRRSRPWGSPGRQRRASIFKRAKTARMKASTVSVSCGMTREYGCFYLGIPRYGVHDRVQNSVSTVDQSRINVTIMDFWSNWRGNKRRVCWSDQTQQVVSLCEREDVSAKRSPDQGPTRFTSTPPLAGSKLKKKIPQRGPVSPAPGQGVLGTIIASALLPCRSRRHSPQPSRRRRGAQAPEASKTLP